MTRQEITEFYGKHHRRLYNIAWRILRTPDEAEEVMQDTILKFVSEERDFASEAQVSAWLARTCIRAAIDRLRSRHREQDFLEEYGKTLDFQDQEYDFPADDPDLLSRIRTALEALPEPYRLVLNLVLLEGLDYQEIAGLTGKKETTLRSLYARGRSKLTDLLNKKI